MYYFEDFQVGASFELGSTRVTEEEVIAFARLYDPQPFHVSPEEAKASPFGGLIASGWQTVVILNRLFVESIFNHTIGLGSPGVDEVRWLKPVRPGDRLKARCRVIESTPSRSRPEMGIVRFQCEVLNQADELVLTLIGIDFLGRRPQE